MSTLYWVESHDTYYPAGGLGDIKAICSSLERAVEVAEESYNDHVCIVEVVDSVPVNQFMQTSQGWVITHKYNIEVDKDYT